MNNTVKLTGVFMGVKLSHESHDQKIYEGYISCKRNSGTEDLIPININERQLNDTLVPGRRVTIDGEFRSYNKNINDKNRLILTLYVKSIEAVNDDSIPDQNEITLIGYVCKQPKYRITPFKREICDLLVAVNRINGKSDYIPCIAWNHSAHYAEELEVGDAITITGRIQSRMYSKKLSDGTVEDRTAYEVSVATISRTIFDDDFEDIFADIDTDSDEDNKGE